MKIEIRFRHFDLYLTRSYYEITKDALAEDAFRIRIGKRVWNKGKGWRTPLSLFQELEHHFEKINIPRT